MAGKQNDYGYFGKGIDGYVHYKQAFDRNFSQSGQSSHSSTHRHDTSVNSSHAQHNIQQNVADSLSGKNVPTQLDDSMMYSDSFYYPSAQQKSTQYSQKGNKKKKEFSGFWDFFSIIIFAILVLWSITGIPTLILTLLTGSMSAAESGVGILILLVGGLFIITH